MTKVVKIKILANDVVNTVNNKQELPKRNDYNWRQYYYILAKAILTPGKDVTSKPVKPISKPQGEYISRSITKENYIKLAEKLVAYVDKHDKLPDYLPYGKVKISNSLACYSFAKIVKYYFEHKQLPAYCNFTTKSFVKPTETTNEVYEYFKDVFGSFGDTIDGALEKIAGKGYGYYYDDVYSNHESIRRMYNGKGVNCTDSSHVFFNIMLELIRKGKYKKVECLHVLCSGGDGHVRLRITMNDGTYIYRDPAAVLSSGDVTYNWCSNGELIAVNPSWFMENLNR